MVLTAGEFLPGEYTGEYAPVSLTGKMKPIEPAVCPGMATGMTLELGELRHVLWVQRLFSAEGRLLRYPGT